MESKEIVCKEDKCTGCYACYNSCPKNCISMNEDQYGFLHPIIDIDKCTNCNLCRKTCPSINEVIYRSPKLAYAAWALDKDERRSSTSGGAASIFSNYILENGGVVFGSSIEDKIIKHIKINKKEDLIKLKGSKYVHSRIGDTYKEAKIELESGRNVLFIGTPCQIAGIQKYLNKDYDNLLTVDIICHGVPSQKILQDYIKENFNQHDFDKISFRDEDGYNFKLLKNNKVVINVPMNESLYYMGFMKSLFCNEACYSCPYATEKRISDITIGDFWGLGEERPFKYDKREGVSLILPNTEKGSILVDKCKNKMFLEERNISEALNGNDQLRRPSIKYKKYDLFRKLYIKQGFNYAAMKSLRVDIYKYKIKTILKKNKFIFKIVKKVRNSGKR